MMTTTNNGGSQSRIAEHVDGIVRAANERGVHLECDQDWRNFSKWADRPAELPTRGAHVRLALDGGGFVRSVQVLDELTADARAAAPAARDREGRRLAVLKAVANFLGRMSQTREEVKSEHVLVLADKWLAWLEQDD